MKEYVRPTALMNSDLAEGVFMSSGAGTCYTANAYVHQQTDTVFRIQVNGKHHGDHTSEQQQIVISFSAPVKFLSGANTTLLSGDGSSTLVLGCNYHQNPNDNIGLGDLTVECTAGSLAVGGVTISCPGH